MNLLLVAVACVLGARQAEPGNRRLELATSVTDVRGLRILANSGFGRPYSDTSTLSEMCEGAFEEVGCYFLDLSLTSGLPTAEAFIFQGAPESLRLRVYLPPKLGDRKVEWREGRLVVSERAPDHPWQPAFEFLP